MASSSPCARAPFARTGSRRAFAGQQETYLNVRGGDAVLDRVRDAGRRSSRRARCSTARRKPCSADTRMAVVVQEMVQADKSGVMFTVDPIRNRRDCMVIEGAPGLGDAIVSGEITPDHYVVSREDGAVVDAFIPDDERGRVLSDAELNAAAETRAAARSVLRISAGRGMVHSRRASCCCCRAGPSRRSARMVDRAHGIAAHPARAALGDRELSRTTARIC